MHILSSVLCLVRLFTALILIFFSETHDAYSQIDIGAKSSSQIARDNQPRVPLISTNLHMVPQLGHSDFVISLDISQNERFVLTGSQDGTARLWDVATGAELRSFQGHIDSVQEVNFVPNRDLALTMDSNRTIRLWNIETGSLVRSFPETHDSETWAVMSRNGRYVIWANKLGQGKIWDLKTDTLRKSLAQSILNSINTDWRSGEITAMMVADSGKFLIIGKKDGTIEQWDLRTGALKQKLTQNKALAILDLTVSEDDENIMSLTNEVSLNQKNFFLRRGCIWEISSGQSGCSADEAGSIVVQDASPTWGWAATAFEDENQVIMWNSIDKKDGKGVKVFFLPGEATALRIARSEKLLVTATSNGAVQLWNVETEQSMQTFAAQARKITAIAQSTDGQYILTGNDLGIGQLWDTSAGAVLRTLSVPGQPENLEERKINPGFLMSVPIIGRSKPFLIKLSDYDYKITAVALSPDGKLALLGNSLAEVWLFDTLTGKPIRNFNQYWLAFPPRVKTLAFSPDQRFILVGSRCQIVCKKS